MQASPEFAVNSSSVKEHKAIDTFRSIKTRVKV